MRSPNPGLALLRQQGFQPGQPRGQVLNLRLLLRDDLLLFLVRSLLLADFSLRLGNHDEALTWLDAACTERSPYLVFLHIEPRMDALRTEPRFQEMLRRIGLAEIRVRPLDAGENAGNAR